jgi:hypothetical protein
MLHAARTPSRLAANTVAKSALSLSAMATGTGVVDSHVETAVGAHRCPADEFRLVRRSKQHRSECAS